MRYSNYPPRIRSIADAFRSIILRSLPLPLPLYTRFISSKFGLGGRGSPRSHGNCYTRALAWSRHLVFSIYGSVRKIREDPFSTNGVPIDSDDRGVRVLQAAVAAVILIGRPAGRRMIGDRSALRRRVIIDRENGTARCGARRSLG